MTSGGFTRLWCFGRYPLPQVHDLVERFGRAWFISNLGLTKGYWQVSFALDEIKETAFSKSNCHMWYPVPIQAATFQRLMDMLLTSHHPYAAAYVDDIVMHSSTWSDHLHHLGEVLKS